MIASHACGIVWIRSLSLFFRAFRMAGQTGKRRCNRLQRVHACNSPTDLTPSRPAPTAAALKISISKHLLTWQPPSPVVRSSAVPDFCAALFALPHIRSGAYPMDGTRCWHYFRVCSSRDPFEAPGRGSANGIPTRDEKLERHPALGPVDRGRPARCATLGAYRTGQPQLEIGLGARAARARSQRTGW